jgi:hypothetical protein
VAQTVGQHGVSVFTSPVNGDALDATVVVANDNTTRSAYVDHDSDTGIHVQSSLLAARPAAGTAGRKWMTTDTGDVNLWFDTGSAWEEIAYLPSAGGTVAGALTVTGLITATGGVSGNVTGAVTGNASTATTLQTSRNINGVAFNGSADITISAVAAAGTLTGATLASNVLASSLTSVGTLSGLTVTAPITGSVTGNAATATALATSRNINGTAFNGTADITVTAAAGTLTGATLASGVTASSLTSVGTLTALTMGGTLAAVDNLITRPRFTDYAETYTTPAISAGTLTLNIENGNVFRVSRNANISTVTISNPAATGNACSFTLIFDANGTSYTITWPAAVKWPGGTAPTITTTASRSDMFVFYTNNAGTTWYAMTAAQNFVTS